MLPDTDLHALLQARHADPFAALGLHADADGTLWVRALLPGAQSVQVVDTASGRRVASLVRRARRDGYTTMVGRVLAGNAPMLALVRRLAFEVAPAADEPGVMVVSRSLRVPARKRRPSTKAEGSGPDH